MNWWNILVFGVAPVLSVIIMFWIKRKLLWIAPILSTVTSIIISIIAMPTLLEGGEGLNMFLGIVIPIQLAVAIILTIVAYLIVHILKKKRISE